MNENTKALLEKAKERFRKLKLFFSILSILVMLTHPIISIYRHKGNLYVNIAVLVVSFIYGALWLHFGNNKAYKINRLYKWMKILLNAVSLGINAYSIYITATNFSILSVIISIAMGTFWFLTFMFNIFYDIASYKIKKFIEEHKQKKQENMMTPPRLTK